MTERRQLWDKAEAMITKLRDIKTPMQNEVKFTKEEILEFSTRGFGLCKTLELLIADIQKYMEKNIE